MDTFLPWAALLAGPFALAIDWWLESSEARKPVAGAPTPFWTELQAMRPTLVGVLVLAGLAIGAAWFLAKTPAIGVGFAIGALAVLIAHISERPLDGPNHLGIVPIGLATAAVGATLFAEKAWRVDLQLGLIMGASLAATLVRVGAPDRSSWPGLTTIYAGALAAASVIGSFRENVERAALVPILIGIVAVIAFALATLWRQFADRQRGEAGLSVFWVGLIGALALIGGAKLIAVKYLFLGDFFLVVAGAVITAGCVAWVLSDDREHQPGTFAMASLIWLAWITIAFGLLQGVGVGIAAVAAASILYLIDAKRAIASMGIVIAIEFYRVFLELYPAESRSIDIGQQYAVMGLMAGAALPIALSHWGARICEAFMGMRGFVLTLLASLITLALLVAIPFVLGSRGVVGFVVGLGLAVFCLGMGGSFRLGLLSLSAGLASSTILAFGYLAPHLGLEREAKIRFLGWGIAASIVILVSAEMLTRRPKVHTPHEEPA
ncbi:MAG: hypothetical protein ACR2HJ_03775 [Fimbriimonadales bacterium]